MLFETFGSSRNPAILFFHAMGVTGASSEPVARHLKDNYYCILPTSTVYCAGQRYISKADEVRQIEAFLQKQKLTVRFLFLLSLTCRPAYSSGTCLRKHLADTFIQKHGRDGDQHTF